MMTLLKWQSKILNKLFKTSIFQQIILDHSNLQLIDYRSIYHVLEKEKDKININMNNNFNNNMNNNMNNNFNNKVILKNQNIEEFIQRVNLICHPTMQSTLVRDHIFKLNELVESIARESKNQQQNYQQKQQQSITTITQQLQQLNQNTKINMNMNMNMNNDNAFESQNIKRSLLNKSKHLQQKYTLEHIIIYSSLSKCKIWPKMLKCSYSLVPSLIKFYNQFSSDFSYDLSYKFDPVILTHKYQKVMNRIEEKKKSFPQLFIAIEKNDMKMIRKLIDNLQQEEKQRDFINQCKKDQYYLSHYAVMHGDLDVIKMLHTEYKINFQKIDHEHQTAVFYAVKRNHFQILTYLVQHINVNINHKQYQNRTPIYLGAFEGNLKIVHYLYSKGANPQMQSKLSRTPLSKACYLGNVSVAEYLIKIGVNLTTIDSKGRTALHNAAWGIQGGREGKKRGNLKLQDSPECAQLLIEAGHPIDLEDFDGFTPLMSAAASLAIKSMRVLIKNGANVNHKTKKNETVVFVAAKYGHLQSLKILIQEYNCQYQQSSIHGVSPLDASFTTDSSDVIFYLLDLYFTTKKILNFQKLIKCLCYYKKQQNLKYLTIWSQNNEQKRKYVYQILFKQISKQNSFINYMFENQKQILPFFMNLIGAQLSKIDQQIVQYLIDRCINVYKKGNLSNFIGFLCQNSQELQRKGINIDNFQIWVHQKQEDIIKILKIDTNMTKDQKSVYRLMLFLVKRRMTKVLLWILTMHNDNLQLQSITNIKPKGICRYTKQQIHQIVKYSTQQSNSIQNYCFIHGIHDAVKILQTQSKGQLKVYIPPYQYSFIIDQNTNPISTLTPVKQKYFDFKYLISTHLSQNQADFYTQSLKFYNKKISEMTDKMRMIENYQDLQKMREELKTCKILGIDVEHFSNSSNEQFICLIQISAQGETYLLDMLSLQRQSVKIVLQQLFCDQQKIKIFHSYDQDLKWITQDFQIQLYRSIIDTSRIFNIFNPKQKSPSLKFLSQSILSYNINKDFQRSDWRIRPLFKQMKIYAGTDAMILPFIYLKQLMDNGVEVGSENEGDKRFYQHVKRQFGAKRYIKSKGRRNLLNIIGKRKRWQEVV